jgi:hypothetical protein
LGLLLFVESDSAQNLNTSELAKISAKLQARKKKILFEIFIGH